MEKTYQFESEKSLVICFNEFEYWEDFKDFKKFICEKLSIEEIVEKYGPYSIFTETTYKGHSITLIYEDYLGCGIGLEKDADDANELARDIIDKCFPGT